MYFRYILKIVPFVLLPIILLDCGGKKETIFNGKTMGTVYQIKLVTGYFKNISGLKAKIDNRLLEINQSMSTYISGSEISRFNALRSTHVKLSISNDFYQVMKTADALYRMTDGAWDGTIKPLVNLWGFGHTDRPHQVPSATAVETLLRRIGFQQIDISDEGYLRKRIDSVSLDLASIAKGYAVDQVAFLIQDAGVSDFLVEIGGEVFAAGYKKEGTPWRVGINRPTKDARLNDVYTAIELHDRAMATSGDYRNYFEENGNIYSHIIDPRTGYPVSNRVVSVSVIADTCTLADGLATAVMVMGHQKGLALLEKLENVEGFIIMRNPDNTLTHYATKGFHPKIS